MDESTHSFQHNYIVPTLNSYITPYINTMDQGVWNLSKSLLDKGKYIISKIHNTDTITLLQTNMNLLSIHRLDYFNTVIGEPFVILNDYFPHE